MLNVRKQNMFNQVHPFMSYIASTPCIAIYFSGHLIQHIFYILSQYQIWVMVRYKVISPM